MYVHIYRERERRRERERERERERKKERKREENRDGERERERERERASLREREGDFSLKGVSRYSCHDSYLDPSGLFHPGSLEFEAFGFGGFVPVPVSGSSA